jgi:hypothetical protein
METAAIVLISLTLFILVIVLVLLTIIIFKIISQKPNLPLNIEKDNRPTDVTRSDFHPDILERITKLKEISKKESDLYCPNHPKEPGEVPCAICDKHFCSSCVKPFKSLYFCKIHLPMVMRNEWEEILKIEASPDAPQNGVSLYDAKKFLFDEKNIPTYIETHYKINVDHNHIETYFVLFSMKPDADQVKKHFQE